MAAGSAACATTHGPRRDCWPVLVGLAGRLTPIGPSAAIDPWDHERMLMSAVVQLWDRPQQGAWKPANL